MEDKGKNHIHRIKNNNVWVTNHEEKEKVILNHFKTSLGRRARRDQDFNWSELNFENLDLSELGAPFTEEETKAAIN
jgi:hypothetical protein